VRAKIAGVSCEAHKKKKNTKNRREHIKIIMIFRKIELPPCINYLNQRPFNPGFSQTAIAELLGFPVGF
jgi:hypothetical protein